MGSIRKLSRFCRRTETKRLEPVSICPIVSRHCYFKRKYVTCALEIWPFEVSALDPAALIPCHFSACIDRIDPSKCKRMKSECGMDKIHQKAPWLPPVLESLEIADTAAKMIEPNESNMNCSGPANSTAPPGCGS